jgi:hypothetical protein
LAAGTTAAAIWIAARPLFTVVLAPVVRHLSSLAPTTILLFALLALGLITWRLGWSRRRAWLGLRYFRSYPPLWVAVAWGLIAAIAWESLDEGKNQGTQYGGAVFWFLCSVSPWAWVILAVSLAAFAVWVIPVHEETRHQVGSACPAESEQSGDFRGPHNIEELKSVDDIIRWFSDDRKIKTPDDDLFNHDAIARRIANRLRSASNGDRAPAIAVLGPLGSGKTSIARLVQHHLRDCANVQLVRVSLWPFDTPEAAVRGLLDELIGSLGQHVDTIGLRGLSDEYVRAIEGFGDRWGALARFLGGPARPEKVLDRISEIARAIHVRFVLWVEDLERFCGTEGEPARSSSADETNRLGPIRALLHLLDECDNLSVIVAGTSLDVRFDLDKIARYVERIPALDPRQVERLFTKLRKHYLEGYPRKIIDPVPTYCRATFLSSNPMLHAIALRSPNYMSECLAIPLLLATPRSLKLALRLTHETWTHLVGEIDLDDVIAASVIKASRPPVFSLLDRHLHALRADFRFALAVTQHDPREHPAFLEIEKQIDTDTSDQIKDAIRCLIRRVFPGYPAARRGLESSESLYLVRPQGLGIQAHLGIQDHVDYWHRYQSLPRIPEEESDQEALSSIKAWKENRPNDLAKRLIDPKRSRQIESFSCLFEGSDIVRLLAEVAQAVAQQAEPSYEGSGNVSGIIPVCKMARRRFVDSNDLSNAMRQIIAEYVPHHLPLVHTIMVYLAHRGTAGVPSLLADGQRDDLTRNLHETLVRTYALGSGAQLLAAVKHGPPYVLLRLSWGLDRIRAGQLTGKPFEGWDQFAGVVLEAAELDPCEGLAQVIPFVTTPHRRAAWVGDETAELLVVGFNEAAARELFDFDRLIRLLAKSEIPAGLREDLRVCWEAARQKARELLQSNMPREAQ